MAFSRHPESLPVLDRFRCGPDFRSPFRTTRTPKLSPRRSCRLGPRSHGSFPLFGGRSRAYLRPDVRLPTSATALRRAGTLPELSILAGTETSISFLFVHVTHDLPCGSGDARRAAQRPSTEAPVPVPPPYEGLPDRDASLGAPPPSTCAAGVEWRLTRTGRRTERRTRPRSRRLVALRRVRVLCGAR
jgi:hypothetical protein